jgi:hypothetical protein
MDMLCKSFWTTTITKERIWFKPQWQVAFTERIISSNIAGTIRELCSIVRAEKYWDNKYTSISKYINWKATAAANKKMGNGRQTWITKHVSGFCAVGTRAKLMGLRQSEECPRCGQIETPTHVWVCKTVETEAIWRLGMNELQRELEERQTDPAIQGNIMQGLQGWRNDQPLQEAEQGTALDLQNKVGWTHFFEGRHHRQWEIEQQKYYHHTQSIRSSLQWSSSIIIKIWQVAWELWTHRNEILHKSNHRLQSYDIDEQIRQIWQQGELHKIRSIKKIIPQNVDEILITNLEKKQQWVARITAAIQREKAKAQDTRFSSERRLMQAYLRR